MRNLGFEKQDSKQIFENNCYRIHRFLLLLINIWLKSDKTMYTIGTKTFTCVYRVKHPNNFD
jgi:hypothetical protein